MDRWLTRRFAVPAVVACMAFAYLSPPLLLDVALVLSSAVPHLAA